MPADTAEQPIDRLVALPTGVELRILDWSPLRSDRHAIDSTWVLTHGLASNARLWDGVAARLARRGHHVVTVDQRGHGRSSKPAGPYDVPTCADDLAALVGELGLDRPAVGGQSWGGNVVLEVGDRHPDLVDQVVCVDGGFIDLQSRFPEWEECRRALAPPKLAGTPLTQMQQWIERSHADWPPEGTAATLANFEVRGDGTVAPWLTHERHLLVLRGLWEHRPSERYPRMRVPVLMIGADTGDRSWSHSKHEAVDAALAALPTGRAEFFVAHHDVHAQRPDEIAALLHAASTDPAYYPTRPPEAATHPAGAS